MGKSEKKSFFVTINLKWLAYIITVATTVYTLVFTYLHNRKSDGYILGDWLVNYEDGGFKRRGLSGTFFFFLQDVTGLDLHFLVYAVQFVIITFFFYTFFRIIRLKKITLLYISLLLSSIGFVGLFNCVDYVGKKEFIIFLIFSLFIYWIQNNKLSKTKEYLVCFFLFLTMFLHEVTLFYVPYFAIALYVKEDKIEIKRYFKYFVAVLVPAFVIFFFGKEINEGHSLEILKQRGVVLTRGIFFWNIDERQYIADHFREYALYPISLAFSVFHVGFYMKTEQYAKKYSKLGLLLILAFLFSLPLFYLAIDWGRWMYIHMMMIVMLFAILLRNGNTIWDYEPVKINRTFYITLFIIVFSLLYRVEMSGRGFTWEGFLYRVFLEPFQLLHKMI